METGSKILLNSGNGYLTFDYECIIILLTHLSPNQKAEIVTP